MLFDRSLVLDPSEALGFVVIGAPSASLTVDGTSVGELGEGDMVVVLAVGPQPRGLSRSAAATSTSILKAKFGLSRPVTADPC